MTKHEFLAALRKELHGLPQNDIDERLSFYSEMIDDKIEEGLSEEEAVSGLGTASDIIAQIMEDTPLTKLVKEKVRPKRSLKAWEILLLILGSPLWFSLLIAGFSVFIAFYAVIVSLIATVWAVEVAMVACTVTLLFAFVLFLSQGHIPAALAILSAAFLCAGIAILGAYGCHLATKRIVFLTKKIGICIKSLFVGKETAK